MLSKAYLFINIISYLFFLIKGCCQLWKKKEHRIATLEFDRERKSMGVIVNSGSGKKSLLVKVHSPLSFRGAIIFGVLYPFNL